MAERKDEFKKQMSRVILSDMLKLTSNNGEDKVFTSKAMKDIGLIRSTRGEYLDLASLERALETEPAKNIELDTIFENPRYDNKDTITIDGLEFQISGSRIDLVLKTLKSKEPEKSMAEIISDKRIKLSAVQKIYLALAIQSCEEELYRFQSKVYSSLNGSDMDSSELITLRDDLQAAKEEAMMQSWSEAINSLPEGGPIFIRGTTEFSPAFKLAVATLRVREAEKQVREIQSQVTAAQERVRQEPDSAEATAALMVELQAEVKARREEVAAREQVVQASQEERTAQTRFRSDPAFDMEAWGERDKSSWKRDTSAQAELREAAVRSRAARVNLYDAEFRQGDTQLARDQALAASQARTKTIKRGLVIAAITLGVVAVLFVAVATFPLWGAALAIPGLGASIALGAGLALSASGAIVVAAIALGVVALVLSVLKVKSMIDARAAAPAAAEVVADRHAGSGAATSASLVNPADLLAQAGAQIAAARSAAGAGDGGTTYGALIGGTDPVMIPGADLNAAAPAAVDPHAAKVTADLTASTPGGSPVPGVGARQGGTLKAEGSGESSAASSRSATPPLREGRQGDDSGPAFR